MNKYRKKTTATLIIAIFLISAFAVVVPVRAADLHVGSGQTYATIQDAINDASPYDTILVHPGTYVTEDPATGDAWIIIDVEYLTVKAMNPAATLVDPFDSSLASIIAEVEYEAADMVNIAASGVVFDGFTVIGADYAVDIYNWVGEEPYSDCVITNNYITGSGDGIWVEGDGHIISDNIIINNDWEGVYIYGSNIELSGNKIYENEYGIYIEGYEAITVSGNIFQNNFIQIEDFEYEVLDIQQALADNTFDRAVVIDHSGGSLLHTIYSSIQAAIDAADTGDTISVAAGTYLEEVTIDKSLTLQGPNVGISPNTGSRVEEAVITGVSPLIQLPSSADVNPLTIEGFTFQDATDSGVTRQGVILANGFSDGWGSVTIRSNRFMNNYAPAVGVWASGSVNSAGWIITDNLIDGVTGPSRSGIYLDMNLDPYTLTGWEISDNTIRNTEYGGIMIDDAVDMVISGNTIEDVKKTGIQPSGISQNLMITGNVITRAMLDQSEPFRAGIRLYGIDPEDEYGAGTLYGPVWVTDNIITDSYIGFAIKDGHDITGKEVHVNGNSFIGNSEANLRHGGTGLLDATLNWWGTSDHLLIADMVFGDVLYIPCLDKSWIALDVNVLPAVVSISVSPMTVNFGSIIDGGDSDVEEVTVTNSGNVAADMTADIGSVWYQTCLHIDGAPYGVGWTLATILADSFVEYDLQLVDVHGIGTYSGVLVFEATPPPPPP